jgi:hypothetical protein
MKERKLIWIIERGRRDKEEKSLNKEWEPGAMTHACNPSYS